MDINNTTITITDAHGNAVSWGSAGKAGFKGSKKSTPFAATVAAEQCAREALSESAVQRALEMIEGLEKIDNVRLLTEILRG